MTGCIRTKAMTVRMMRIVESSNISIPSHCLGECFIKWLRKSFFNSPSQASDAIFYRARSIPKLSIPLSLRQSLAVKFYEMICARIIGLHKFCRPMAVFEAVIPVIISSIDRMLSAGSIAHIRKEVLESAPSIANRNASSPVVLKFLDIGICASVHHQVPDIVNRIAFASGLTMSSSWLIRSNPLFLQTPTRTRSVGAQHFTANPSFVAANTDAFPVSAMRASDLWLLIKNRPSIKCLAAKLNDWSHGLKLTFISMDYKGASHGI